MDAAEELGESVEFKWRNLIFERCIELGGDGDAAKRELVYKIRQAQSQ